MLYSRASILVEYVLHQSPYNCMLGGTSHVTLCRSQTSNSASSLRGNPAIRRPREPLVYSEWHLDLQSYSIIRVHAWPSFRPERTPYCLWFLQFIILKKMADFHEIQYRRHTITFHYNLILVSFQYSVTIWGLEKAWVGNDANDVTFRTHTNVSGQQAHKSDNIIHFFKAIPVTGRGGPIGLWDVEAVTFSRQSAHRWRWGQPYAPAGRPLSSGKFLILTSVRGWVDYRAIVRLEELGQLRNLMTSSGTEPATFRLVA
jgi:hypothetical protein